MGEIKKLVTVEYNIFNLKIGTKTVLEGVRLGDSISVNGMCLKVTQFDTQLSEFTIRLAPKNLRKNLLSELFPDSLVNLERAIQPTSRMEDILHINDEVRSSAHGFILHLDSYSLPPLYCRLLILFLFDVRIWNSFVLFFFVLISLNRVWFLRKLWVLRMENRFCDLLILDLDNIGEDDFCY